MTATRTWIAVAMLTLALLVPGVVQAQTPTPVPTITVTQTPTPTVIPMSTASPVPISPMSGMTLDRLKNTTYPSEYSPSKQVTLIDGKAEWNEPPLRGNAVFVDAKVAPDFAAVILGSSTGGSGSFTSLHLITGTAAAPIAGPGVFIGDRTRVESIGFESNGIRLDLLTQGPTDPQCCPTQRETRTYVRDGNTFRLVSTTITQPGSGPLTPPPATGAVTPPKTGNLGLADSRSDAAPLLALAVVTVTLAARRRTGTR